jgi:hypothetical protein
MAFKSSMLRRIFGLKKEKVIEHERKLCKELYNFYSKSDNSAESESRNMRWI